MKRKWWPKVMLCCVLVGLYLFFAGMFPSINFFSALLIFLILLRIFWADLKEHYSKEKNSLFPPKKESKIISRREIISMIFLGFLFTFAFYKSGNWNWIAGLSILAVVYIWFWPLLSLFLSLGADKNDEIYLRSTKGNIQNIITG